MRLSIDSEILTDIADSIREKTSTTNKYYPQNMATAISSIAGITPTGTLPITSNNTYDVTNYASVDVNVAADFTQYYRTSLGSGSNGNYSGLDVCIKELPDNYFIPSGSNISFSFYNTIGLTKAPMIDLTGVTNVSRMFMGCSSLTTVPQYNTTNVTTFDGMFVNCSSLTTVPVLNLSSATSLQYFFTGCTNLSDNSINNILASLTGATSYTGTKTLAYIGINSNTATAQEIQAMSNYNAFVAAGWTIGY